MRIAVWHNLPSGGGKRALYDHVRGLVARGHHVEAWCPASADTAFLPLSELCSEHVLPWTCSRSNPLLIPSIRRDSLDQYARIQAIDDHCRRAAAAINSGGFDVLLANTCQVTASPFIGRYSTIPTCLYLQEPYRMLYEAWPDPPFAALPPPGRSVFAPWYLRQRLADYFRTAVRRFQIRAEHENAKSFSRILVNSYFSRESVWRAYGLNSSVCYLGVDVERYSPDGVAPLRENAVVGIGAYGKHKNIEFVIRAVGKVSPPRPDLIWIGNSIESDELERLRSIATVCGVTFRPHVRIPDAEVAALLRRPFAMVYAPRLEPFGYAPIEANAAGLPVIAVAEGGVRETIRDGENGLLVDATPAAMAAGIELLRDDPALARKLGVTGRDTLRDKWSLTTATDRLETYLSEMAGVPAESETVSCVKLVQRIRPLC